MTSFGAYATLAVSDLYSRRKQVAEGNVPDVYVYGELPGELRIQVVYIWREAVGLDNPNGWSTIHNVVAREHGVMLLARGRDARRQCEGFLRAERAVDRVLDIIEVSFRYIEIQFPRLRDYERQGLGITVTSKSAVEELNVRFRQAGVGYRFESGQIVRIDSELIHSEVVQPALGYLQQRGFEGPRDEFLKAHGHYRAGETKEAITNANNAFESTLKAICDQRGWQYAGGATASQLVKVVKQKGLLPSYLDKSFDQLAATLQSGLPKVRDEQGAHGQGALPRKTPDYVAAYALHLAAAKILFLAEAHEGMAPDDN